MISDGDPPAPGHHLHGVEQQVGQQHTNFRRTHVDRCLVHITDQFHMNAIQFRLGFQNRLHTGKRLTDQRGKRNDFPLHRAPLRTKMTHPINDRADIHRRLLQQVSQAPLTGRGNGDRCHQQFGRTHQWSQSVIQIVGDTAGHLTDGPQPLLSQRLRMKLLQRTHSAKGDKHHGRDPASRRQQLHPVTPCGFTTQNRHLVPRGNLLGVAGEMAQHNQSESGTNHASERERQGRSDRQGSQNNGHCASQHQTQQTFPLLGNQLGILHDFQPGGDHNNE